MEENKGFNPEWLQKLRDANDLVTVVSKYCVIKRQGRKFFACCPFHHEKTPSFCINQGEEYFHCFGCGESGDVITFIEKMESLDFLDAVKYLADRCGMKVPEFTGSKEIFELKQKKDRFLSLLKDALKFYQGELYKPTATQAQKYVRQRELTKKEIEKFQIGYSSSWMGIVDYLKSKGHKEEDMLEVGIVSKDEKGRLFDFFAMRLMFPLFNKFGDCVGFSGRDIEGNARAKYKNSIQSLVFDKSSTVFALNIVKDLKQTEHIPQIIICEGQMDVISMHKAGFNTAVACLGTAITVQHAREIKRIADKVVMCLDGDSAGISATLKAIPILKSQDLDVKVAKLVGGKDPDEIIKANGKDFMANIISSAIDNMEYQIDAYGKMFDTSNGEGKAKFLKASFELLQELPNMSSKMYYVPQISKISKVPQNVILEDISSSFNGISVKKSTNVQVVQTDNRDFTPDALLKSQIFILASVISGKEFANNIQELDLLLKDKDLINLYNYLCERQKNKEHINKVIIFDMFGESCPIVKECINYNFEDYKDEELNKQYQISINFIRRKKIDMEIEELSNEIKGSVDNDKRNNLILELSKKIKEKQTLK